MRIGLGLPVSGEWATPSYGAARTESIRLAVAVVNLPFVSPAYLAKQGRPRILPSRSAPSTRPGPVGGRRPGVGRFA